MIWICLGYLLVATTFGVAFYWAVDRSRQALQRVPRFEEQVDARDPKPGPGRLPVIEGLGSLSAFDNYMARAAGEV